MAPRPHGDTVDALCHIGRLFGERRWCLATSGNFSARVDDGHCVITQSGVEKSRLSPQQLMVCDLNGTPADQALRPSAETAVHTELYRLDRRIAAVLHTHSVPATLVSRHAADPLTISGFEMQKAQAGVTSHEQSLSLPVFDNTQDMRELARLVRERREAGDLQGNGFLVRGHGLYAWGESLEVAQRHVEGLEFLLECTWQEILAGNR